MADEHTASESRSPAGWRGWARRLVSRLDLALVAIAIVGLLLRIGWVVKVDAAHNYSDAQFFIQLAHNLAAGLGYTQDGVTPTAFHPVGYPATLAAFFELFGDERLAGELLNLVASIVTIVLTYVLGRQLYDRRIGLIAAGVMALLPSHIISNSLLLSEVLFTAVQLAAIVLVVEGLRRTDSWTTSQTPRVTVGTGVAGLFLLPSLDGPRALAIALLAAIGGAVYLLWRRGQTAVVIWLAAGLLTGYALLIRSAAVAVLVAGVVCLYLALPADLRALRWRERVRRLALSGSTRLQVGLFVGGILVLCLPWVVRNWNEVGAANLSTNGGINLLAGNHDGATGCSSWNAAEHDYLFALEEPERDRKAVEEALDFVSDDPLQAAALVIRRFNCTWEDDSWVVNLNGAGLEDSLSTTEFSLSIVAARWYYFALLAFALIGIPAWWRRTPQHLLLAMVVGLTALGYLIILGDQRYHQPLLPIFAVWAAAGITMIPRWLKLAGAGSEDDFAGEEPSSG